MDRETHLVLSSTGSTDVYPGNQPSDFTTSLAIPLDFEDVDYEMGLVEFQIVRSMPTPSNGKVVITMPNLERSEVSIPNTDISNVTDLVKTLNNVLSEHSITGITVTFNTSTFKTNISLTANHTIELSDELARVLGFKNKLVTESSISDSISDLFHGSYHIHIYSDITEQVRVGGGMESLLGIVSIPKGVRCDSMVATNVFPNPMFLKIVKNRVASIRIYLKDDHHKPIHCKLGPTVVRLLVRRTG